MATDDDDFKETIHMTEDQKWQQSCGVIGSEIAELLEINLRLIQENYRTGAPSPSITLHLKAPGAGDLPHVNIKINIPKLKGQDERDVDLNQPRWFQGQRV